MSRCEFGWRQDLGSESLFQAERSTCSEKGWGRCREIPTLSTAPRFLLKVAQVTLLTLFFSGKLAHAVGVRLSLLALFASGVC